MEYQVTHLPEEQRFEIIQDGITAYLEYNMNGNNMEITHTIVPPPIEGKGIASALVEYAWEYAQTHALNIVPYCSYVRVWMQRHGK